MECYIDDTHTFYMQLHHTDFVATDATGTPAYRVYEETTDTPILTGSFALLDDANTTGLYRAQITLSAANGFEIGKCYMVRGTATVSGNAQAWIVSRFIVRADPTKMIRYFTNANTINTSTGAGTVLNDAGSATLYTYTVTSSPSANTRTKGAIS